ANLFVPPPASERIKVASDSRAGRPGGLRRGSRPATRVDGRPRARAFRRAAGPTAHRTRRRADFRAGTNGITHRPYISVCPRDRLWQYSATRESTDTRIGNKHRGVSKKNAA